MIDAMISILAFLITATAFCIYIHVIPKRMNYGQISIHVVSLFAQVYIDTSVILSYNILGVWREK